jgi:hypothetical protein
MSPRLQILGEKKKKKKEMKERESRVRLPASPYLTPAPRQPREADRQPSIAMYRQCWKRRGEKGRRDMGAKVGMRETPARDIS